VTFHRILVAVDGSVIAAVAFDTGVELARALQAELAIV
jgi:nucleotide-binding universal stress UspA family protein